MEAAIPRIVLAGTNSGCGKTTVSCAVLQAFVNRGCRVGAFKCGPDYIDPMFHSSIIGAKSANLDPYFFNPDTLNYLLLRNGADRDLSIIEGVMGFYDGLSLSSAKASTYEVAQVTKSPVVLVVDARGASLSVLAVISGFMDFLPDSGICGVILNRCTAATYRMLGEAILSRFCDRVKPLGFLPRIPESVLESRHLGLITAAEVHDLREKLSRLAAQAEETIDLEGLVQLANAAPPVASREITLRHFDEPVRIAVAKDKAFCFYYEDSLQALRDSGADLVEFSPLEDASLPDGIHGMYLGGGYPELYTEQLSANTAMLASIRAALERGLPCIAECGGFMYLTERIGTYPMVGYLPGACFDTGKLTRFGYVRLKAKHDCMLCAAGEEIPGHEFHHWDCEHTGNGFTANKESGKHWDCVVSTDRLYAGFPHFHFFANPAFAANFYETCLKEKKNHD